MTTAHKDNQRVPARMPAFLIPGPTSFKDKATRDKFERVNLIMAYIWMGYFGLCAVIIVFIVIFRK
jgi:hypothetical protein